MANITVRGLDDALLERLDQEAKLQGSRAVQGSDAHHDLDALIGAWDQEEADAFAAAVMPFNSIHPATWS